MKERNRKCLKCGSSPAEDPSITLYRFPKPGTTNSIRCGLWAKYCFPDETKASSEKFQLKLYSEHRMLCSKHFEENSFLDFEAKKLHRFATPYENLQHHQSEETILEECSISPYEERSSPQIDEEEVIINEDENKENNTGRKGHICDMCKGTIQGFRYKCVQCVEFNLCTKCEANSEHPHHFMLRIPWPMPHDTLERVLEVLQPLQNYFVPIKEDQEECDDTLLEGSVVEYPKHLEHDIEHPVECTKIPLATSIKDPLQLTPIQPIKPVVIQLSIDSKNPKTTLKTQGPKRNAKRLRTNENLNVKRTKEKSVNKEKCYSNVREFIESFSHRIEPESNRRKKFCEDSPDTDKRNLDDSEMCTNEEYIDEGLLDDELEELLS